MEMDSKKKIKTKVSITYIRKKKTPRSPRHCTAPSQIFYAELSQKREERRRRSKKLTTWRNSFNRVPL